MSLVNEIQVLSAKIVKCHNENKANELKQKKEAKHGYKKGG